MRRSRLPPGGENVFQRLRARRAEAVARGARLIDLSIGEPRGPALESAREAAAAAVRSSDEAMHAYQYNASPAVPRFSERFIARMVRRDLEREDGLGWLPIPGIKPMLGLVPLACGCAERPLTVATTTEPGYPIPADWCALHPHVVHYALPLGPGNGFRFAPGDIRPGTGLVMMNYPHNPSGQIGEQEWLRSVCAACEARDIRLFNDAAYSALAHVPQSTTLSEVAPDFPDLSWGEAFTAAKVIGNGTGWHVGAMVGSADFIADMAAMKGKTDEGFVAPMARGVIEAVENDWSAIEAIRAGYERRLERLIGILEGAGMRLPVRPRAAFYTLWETPRMAFGEPVASAEAFNTTLVERTGLVGVPFEPYVRYAVCADIEAMEGEIGAAFEAARVSY